MKTNNKFTFQFQIISESDGVTKGIVLADSFTKAMLKLQKRFFGMSGIETIAISRLDFIKDVGEIFIGLD
jgi:hypothetical protein